MRDATLAQATARRHRQKSRRGTARGSGLRPRQVRAGWSWPPGPCSPTGAASSAGWPASSAERVSATACPPRRRRAAV